MKNEPTFIGLLEFCISRNELEKYIEVFLHLYYHLDFVYHKRGCFFGNISLDYILINTRTGSSILRLNSKCVCEDRFLGGALRYDEEEKKKHSMPEFHHAAPELLLGKKYNPIVTPAADIYSLSSILFYCITGQSYTFNAELTTDATRKKITHILEHEARISISHSTAEKLGVFFEQTLSPDPVFRCDAMHAYFLLSECITNSC